MDFTPLDSLLNIGKAAIERIWPDPIKRAEEVRKLEELHQQGDLARLDAHVKLMLGQVEVNKAEAQHKSVFVAGWRPFIGWVGGSALAYQFVVYPLLCWFWRVAQALGWVPVGMETPPVLETGALFSMITAMLGVGAMRSFDKKQGTQTDRIK
ncbi:holin family protein [Microbulbifer sp. SAOS-129_SWC]|uniref:holin family protein n=1 Tax=Microbulbifer sp. SAOS-129_SWC TaxID=3145235 RepID=UPI0032171B50